MILRYFFKFDIRKQKNEKIKKNSIQIFVIKLIVRHQIENCELYEIKFSILKTTNNEILKSCFFLII